LNPPGPPRPRVNATTLSGLVHVMDDTDTGLVRALIPHWYATRKWAEELLCRALNLKSAGEVLQPEHRGRKVLAGSTWTYRTHGIGVDIDRGITRGGIDFDFDKPDPDPWRLKIFAEKQLNAGNLGPEYAPLVDDENRFKSAAEAALSIERGG
jgi:hypothetical protein